MSCIIKINNLIKDFNTQKAVVHSLRGIDLSVEEGETIAIVGESGAGKSTLLHIIGTLEAPSSGEVIIDGINPFKYENNSLNRRRYSMFNLWKDLRAEKFLAKFRNENIGFVFQFHHLLPEFSALVNVMMPPLIKGIDKKRARQMSEEALCAVGLKDRLTHKPSELSGGEQQRVAIARAIILNPKMLLTDEPTGNLDTRTSSKIHDILIELNEKNNMTLIIVTHNLSFAKGMKKIITLLDGKIV